MGSVSRVKFDKIDNRTKRIKNTQFERKAVMIHMAMVKDVMFGKTMRKSYAKYEEILEIPNMLKIQKDSYQWFLETGLREVFKDVGTITGPGSSQSDEAQLQWEALAGGGRGL